MDIKKRCNFTPDSRCFAGGRADDKVCYRPQRGAMFAPRAELNEAREVKFDKAGSDGRMKLV